jgi:acid phosphatase family membrane protein YuiD
MPMNFPIYDEADAKFAAHDGNVSIIEFSEFISQLIEQDEFENSTEKGIITLVDSRGTEVLTTKQAKVLEIVISRYEGEECKLCGEPIPLNEVLYHELNDGYCSYHKNQADKNFE